MGRIVCGVVPCHFISRPPQAGRKFSGLSPALLVPGHFIRLRLRAGEQSPLALLSHLLRRAGLAGRRPPARVGSQRIRHAANLTRKEWGGTPRALAAAGRRSGCAKTERDPGDTLLRDSAAGNSLPAAPTPRKCRRKGRRLMRIRTAAAEPTGPPSQLASAAAGLREQCMNIFAATIRRQLSPAVEWPRKGASSEGQSEEVSVPTPRLSVSLAV
jgi:hypothetical protein